MWSRMFPLVNLKMHFQMLPNYILERISKGQVRQQKDTTFT